MRSALCFLVLVAGCSSHASNDTTTVTDAGVTLPAGAAEIVVNEFHALGTDEWLEIANKGTDAFTLDGYAIADSKKGTTQAKTDEALRFPTGTSIAAGEHLVLLLNQDDDVGPYTDPTKCAGRARCFHGKFAVSANDGEAVHFLGPSDVVVATTFYPRNLGIDPTKNQDACRLPDLTGELVVCASTPGAINAGP